MIDKNFKQIVNKGEEIIDFYALPHTSLFVLNLITKIKHFQFFNKKFYLSNLQQKNETRKIKIFKEEYIYYNGKFIKDKILLSTIINYKQNKDSIYFKTINNIWYGYGINHHGQLGIDKEKEKIYKPQKIKLDNIIIKFNNDKTFF
jgi:alpha-tubulin suppressor-like RCC1 family protein